MNASSAVPPASPNPAKPSTLKRVTIGPVDSKHPGFDKDLRDYLAKAGFASDRSGVEWHKEFDSPIAADVAIEAVYAQIGRLVGLHAPQLPNAMLF